jgi:nucleoside-diphosphate-sugar epimerase
VDARGLRGPPWRPARARRGAEAVDGCTHVIHLAAIVGGIANFHKLPLTLTEVNGALYNAVVRAAVEAQGLERFVYVSSSMVFEQATEYPTTRSTSGPARSPLGLRLLQAAGRGPRAGRDDEFGLPWTICRPFNAYGPGELPEDEPGIAHMVPDVIRKVLTWRQASRSRSSATGPRRAPSRTSTTSPTGS